MESSKKQKMAPVKVTVKWGSKQFDLEIDPESETVQDFRAKIFSLTNVPVERQKIMVRALSLFVCLFFFFFRLFFENVSTLGLQGRSLEGWHGLEEGGPQGQPQGDADWHGGRD